MNLPVITAREISHEYQEGHERRQVLANISFEIFGGEVVMLTGPSGSGKSTLLTLIGALRSVQVGSLRVLGHELRSTEEHTRALLRREIGYIFQSHNLLESLTAQENVEIALGKRGQTGGENARDSAAKALAKVGLEDRGNAFPRELSGGQRQRVAIARALVSKPKLVLADEPTASLDRESGRDVMELLQRLAHQEGVAVIVVTHDNRILDAADRIVGLEGGRLTSLMHSVSNSTQQLLGHVSRDFRYGDLEERVASLSRNEFLDAMREITEETQSLLSIVDTIQSATFKHAEERFVLMLSSKLGEVFGADEAGLYMVDYESGTLWTLRESDTGERKELRISMNHGTLAEVVRTGETLALGSTPGAADIDSEHSRPAAPGELYYPIADSRQQVFAVVHLKRNFPGTLFSETDRLDLAEFAVACSSLLESWWRMGCTCRSGPVGDPASCCKN